MKKIIIGIAFFTLYTIVSYATEEEYASDETKLGLFIRSEFDDLDPEQLAIYERDYVLLINRFREKRKVLKSDALFLKHVFYTVHRKMLGEYEQYVTFSEIFKKTRKYDCVTGTALYALILDDLGVQYQIHETDYHVYLTAHVNSKEYLFESTDPLNGFAWDPTEIEERRDFVNKESIRINTTLEMEGVTSNQPDLQSPAYIDNVVNLRQLAGLHYYNQALKNFNKEAYQEAYKMIIIAQGIYPTQRIKHASSFMFSAAFED